MRLRVHDKVTNITRECVGFKYHGEFEHKHMDLWFINGNGEMDYCRPLRSDIEFLRPTGQLNHDDDREIYEGDFVKYNALSPMSEVEDGLIGKVEFLECCFWVVPKKGEPVRLFTECREWSIVNQS